MFHCFTILISCFNNNLKKYMFSRGYNGLLCCVLLCVNPESVQVHFLGIRDADRLPLIIGRLKALNLSLITLQQTLSSIVDGSLRVCSVRTSRADVKRIRGGAQIYSFAGRVRTTKYTYRLITLAILPFARALMKHAREKKSA